MNLTHLTKPQAYRLQQEYAHEYLSLKQATNPSTTTRERCMALLILSRRGCIQQHLRGSKRALKESHTLIPARDIQHAASFPSH